MIPASPYNAAVDDLWLYQLESVTYGSVTQTLLRPYAWNPNCSLYGYRNSLQALRASNRTFSTYAIGPFGVPQQDYDHFVTIMPDNLENRPVYYNSFPPTWVKMSDQHLRVCAHCFDVAANAQRDPNSSFANYYGDSLQVIMGYRWIKSDNTIINKTASDFTVPYVFDGEIRAGAPKYQDVACIDLKSSLDVPAVTLANAQSLTQGTPIFCIDSNGKVIDSTFICSWVIDTAGSVNDLNYGFPLVGTPPTTQGAMWVFVETQGHRNLWLHDSGDLWFVEISPPSSPEAGDGILAMLPTHLVSPESVFYEPTLGTELLPPDGAGSPLQTIVPSQLSAEFIAWQQYWQGRGVTYQFLNAPRGNNALASEVVEQQILQIAQQITENI